MPKKKGEGGEWGLCVLTWKAQAISILPVRTETLGYSFTSKAILLFVLSITETYIHLKGNAEKTVKSEKKKQKQKQSTNKMTGYKQNSGSSEGN